MYIQLAVLMVFVALAVYMQFESFVYFPSGYLNWYGLPYSYGVRQIQRQCKDNCLTSYQSGCMYAPTVACSDRFAACVGRCSLK